MRVHSVSPIQILAMLLAFLFTPKALAYSPATPYRHVVSNGKFFFVMFPTEYRKKRRELFEVSPPRGIAYKVTSEGKFQKLWSVEGWYAFPGDVLLSEDGKSLVWIREDFLLQDGNIFGDDESDTLLTIYRKGKVLKEYAAKDLITDLKEGIRFDGYSGFKWVNRHTLDPVIAPSRLHRIEEITEGEITVSYAPDVLQLATFEGFLFLFDLKTGWVLTKRKETPEDDEVDVKDVDPFADPFGDSEEDPFIYFPDDAPSGEGTSISEDLKEPEEE